MQINCPSPAAQPGHPRLMNQDARVGQRKRFFGAPPQQNRAIEAACRRKS